MITRDDLTNRQVGGAGEPKAVLAQIAAELRRLAPPREVRHAEAPHQRLWRCPCCWTAGRDATIDAAIAKLAKLIEG